MTHLRLSVHLNFTYGRPASPPEEVRSLCSGGRFRGLPGLLLGMIGGRVSADEMALETRRQIRRLKALGVPVTGVEGHHHVHLIPGVIEAVGQVLIEEGIKWLRVPVDPSHIPSFFLGLIYLGRSRLQPVRLYQNAPTLYLRGRDYRCWNRGQRKLLDSRRAVIVHPAKYDDGMPMTYPDPLRQQRVVEYRRLLAWSRLPPRG